MNVIAVFALIAVSALFPAVFFAVVKPSEIAEWVEFEIWLYKKRKEIRRAAQEKQLR